MATSTLFLAGVLCIQAFKQTALGGLMNPRQMEEDTEGLVHLKYSCECVIEVTASVEKSFRDVFEIEMLRGTREPLPDGRARITFAITDEAKGKRLVEFIQRLPQHRVTCLN